MSGRPIDKIASMPPELQSRFRGRSVPSPQAKKPREQKEKAAVENHIVPYSFDIVTAGEERMILIATSELKLESWKLYVHTLEKDVQVKLLSRSELGVDIFTFPKLTEGLNEFDSNLHSALVRFTVPKDDELLVTASGPINATLTMEFLRNVRTLS